MIATPQTDLIHSLVIPRGRLQSPNTLVPTVLQRRKGNQSDTDLDSRKGSVAPDCDRGGWALDRDCGCSHHGCGGARSHGGRSNPGRHPQPGWRRSSKNRSGWGRETWPFMDGDPILSPPREKSVSVALSSPITGADAASYPYIDNDRLDRTLISVIRATRPVLAARCQSFETIL